MKTQGNIKLARMQITALLIVAPLFLSLFRMLLPKLPSSPAMRDSFWAHKVDAKPVYDVVFTGDSRIYRGIDPEVIEKSGTTDLRCFNYGFSSAGLDSFLLEKACSLLDPAGKKVLVIGLSANSFLPSSLKNEHLRSLLKWSSADVWIRKKVYPYLGIFDPYAVSDLYKLYKGEKYIEDYHIHTGFAASRKVPADSTSALKAYEEQFGSEVMDAEVEIRFITHLRSLIQRGFNVMVVRMPTSHAMKLLEDKHKASRFREQRKELEAIGIVWLEFDGGYVSYDGSHLEEHSSERLSMELSRKIELCAH